MNIFIFSRSTIKHFISGGMETHLDNLANGLISLGHEITIITTSYPTSDKFIEKETKIINENGIKYVYIGETTPGLNPVSKIEKFFLTVKILKRNKNNLEGKLNYFKESSLFFKNEIQKGSFCDVIISQSTAGQGLSTNLDIPIVSIIHGTIINEIKNRLKSNRSAKNWIRFIFVDLPRWYYELITSNRKFFKRVNIIVAVSNILKRNFVSQSIGINKNELKYKTKVIYNGVDSKRFKPGNKKYPKFTLLYVGRMDREKGIDLIIKAVSILKQKTNDININVKLIGGGDYLEELKDQATKAGINDLVEFCGQVNNSDLPKYYQMSHVFVLPTRREEGHPMTVSEAYLCGLPVIGTNMGGLSEVIKDKVTGYFINRDDAKDLAEKLDHIIKSPEVLTKMSKNAHEYSKLNFSQNSMSKSYEKLLKSLIHGKK